MAYAFQQAPAIAGQIGKGNLANAKTTAERVATETAIKAGRFVALSATGGVKALTAKTDVLAGVVIYSAIKDEWRQSELLDVMHIEAGDAIWVEIAKGETVNRADKVYAVAVANGEKLAGTIQGKADTTNCIQTDYHIIAVSGTLALITKL